MNQKKNTQIGIQKKRQNSIISDGFIKKWTQIHTNVMSVVS